MNISLAEIRSGISLASNGTFLSFVEADNAQRTVVYTSPQRSGRDGGILALPSINQKILVCKPSDRDPWFYLGTVWTPPEGITDGSPIEDDDKHPVDTVDDRLYKARGVPMRTTIATDGGNRVLLSDEYNPKYFNRRLELRSAVGKRVKLLDSPEQDCIFIVNEHRDGIKITSEPDITSAAQSIEIESRGPQKFICREGQTDIWVTEGRELNIINTSTGLYKDPLEPGRWGNVNLESMHAGINIRTRSQSGNIIIQNCGRSPESTADDTGTWDGAWPNAGEDETFGSDLFPERPAKIVIMANGAAKGPHMNQRPEVIISSNGKITLLAEHGDIDMIARKGNINMGAAGTINLFSAGSMNSVEIGGGGGINIDAGLPGSLDQVHINSGIASNAPIEGWMQNTLYSMTTAMAILPPAFDAYINKGIY